jgi:hypothetical protein
MNLKVELTINGWQMILEGLDNLPHGKVRPLIDEVQRQLQPQIESLRQTQQAPLADKVIN